MRTIRLKVKVYKYDELSEEAKEKVLDFFYNNLEVDLRKQEREILNKIKQETGLEFKELYYELYRPTEVFFYKEDVIKAVKKLYPYVEDLILPPRFGIYVSEFMGHVNVFESQICQNFVRFEGCLTIEEQEKQEREIFLKLDKIHKILKEGLKKLEEGYSYQTSREYIEDFIRSNEYEFYEDGTLY